MDELYMNDIMKGFLKNLKEDQIAGIVLVTGTGQAAYYDKNIVIEFLEKKLDE